MKILTYFPESNWTSSQWELCILLWWQRMNTSVFRTSIVIKSKTHKRVFPKKFPINYRNYFVWAFFLTWNELVDSFCRYQKSFKNRRGIINVMILRFRGNDNKNYYKFHKVASKLYLFYCYIPITSISVRVACGCMRDWKVEMHV